MASSLPYNPFERGPCLPCLNNDGQSDHNTQIIHTQVLPTISHQYNISGRDGMMKQTEDLLASEMNKLSVQERSKALDDVHCVGEELKETPELVQKSLADFDQAVRKQHTNYPIYVLAVNQNRAFVEDPAFRLKFLRANLHDVDKSVRQMMNFLRYKAKYFGQDKVAREISVSDLTEEDIELILSGMYHIQEGRDRMGRVIVHYLYKEQKRTSSGNYGIDAIIRAIFYICWNVLIAIPEVQMKGLASVYNAAYQPPGMNLFLKDILLFYNALPLRMSVSHICIQKSSGGNDGLFWFALKHLPQSTQVRARIHHGSSMEMQYQLRSHGIPKDRFPLDEDGNIRQDIILNLWFEKHLEETNQIMVPFHQKLAARLGSAEDHTGGNKMAGGIIPTKMDVLLGRGYKVQWHYGNIQYRNFLEQHRVEYETISRVKKREISLRLAQSLRSQGVRFLQKNEIDQWVVSDDGEVDTRICQYFRELRKKDAKNRKRR